MVSELIERGLLIPTSEIDDLVLGTETWLKINQSHLPQVLPRSMPGYMAQAALTSGMLNGIEKAVMDDPELLDRAVITQLMIPLSGWYGGKASSAAFFEGTEGILLTDMSLSTGSKFLLTDLRARAYKAELVAVRQWLHERVQVRQSSSPVNRNTVHAHITHVLSYLNDSLPDDVDPEGRHV